MAADSLILIIDDDEAVRISLSMHLEDMGYECLLAADGVEGLTLFSENNPDCVLVDLRMPGMNGMDVIKKITGITKEIPVIVVSSQDHLGNAIDAVRAGAWDYILKPIESMEIVTHCVNKALEKKELLENRREYQENLEKRVETRTTLLKNANEELKQKTRDLENMLDEKTLLLNEIHHRVKNNMQVITSFISLEENDTRPRPLKSILIDISSRIYAMAYVHEVAYDSDHFSSVELYDFCQKLSTNLFSLHKKVEMEFECTIECIDKTLDLNSAVTLGLVINEFITNSLKYAFPGSKSGRISIFFSCNDDGVVTMEYSDSGLRHAYYDDTDPEKLEMAIINALLGQINARFKYKYSEGTRLTLHF